MPKNRTLSAVGACLLIVPAVLAQTPPPTASTESPKTGLAAAPAAGSVEAAQAAVKAAEAEQPPTETELFLDAAIKAVDSIKTVSADLTQSVEMLDQRFSVTGRYRKGPENRIYLYLKVNGLTGTGGEILQVCDGKVLWDSQQVLDSKSYRRIEVAQVFEKLKSPELDEEMRQQVSTSLGFSGPAELLKGLRRSVCFLQAKTSETVDGKDYWVLRGKWKSRQGLTGPNQTPVPANGPIPAYVPSDVVLRLGQKDNWPYKLRLAGTVPSEVFDTRPIGPDGRRIGPKSSIQQVKPTVIELTYENVKIDTDLPAEEFVFTAPSNARVDDQTQAVVGMLDQAIQVRAAQKKAEAAKGGDDSVLKESIRVPRADVAAPAAPAPLAPPGPAASPR